MEKNMSGPLSSEIVTKEIFFFAAFGQKHDPSKCQLFLHSSELNLKAVLLHNGNKYPYLPTAYAVNIRCSKTYILW